MLPRLALLARAANVGGEVGLLSTCAEGPSRLRSILGIRADFSPELCGALEGRDRLAFVGRPLRDCPTLSETARRARCSIACRSTTASLERAGSVSDNELRAFVVLPQGAQSTNPHQAIPSPPLGCALALQRRGPRVQLACPGLMSTHRPSNHLATPAIALASTRCATASFTCRSVNPRFSAGSTPRFYSTSIGCPLSWPAVALSSASCLIDPCDCPLHPPARPARGGWRVASACSIPLSHPIRY